MSLHTKLANAHPSLLRGIVWCRTCGRSQRVDSSKCLRHGWPKCCGYTMTIDHPDTWPHPDDEGPSAGLDQAKAGKWRG